MVESMHEATAVAIPTGGAALLYGKEDRGTFLRSVAKPFQTLALFRGGVIDHHGLSNEEIAVVTASHGGEREHRRRVEGLLQRGGFTIDDLRCGAHEPFTASERRRMIAAGETKDQLCNNCSGKHAGMLLHSLKLGADPARYLEIDHPVQRAVSSLLSQFLDIDLTHAVSGVDGCGAPTWFVSLKSMAGAFSRLADHEFMREQQLASAAARLHAALGATPLLYSGEQRFPFLWSTYLLPDLYSKDGAEGVYVVWGKPGALVIKATDGLERGYQFAVPSLLRSLGWIDDRAWRRWLENDPPVVRNVAGRKVGKIEVALPRPTVLRA